MTDKVTEFMNDLVEKIKQHFPNLDVIPVMNENETIIIPLAKDIPNE